MNVLEFTEEQRQLVLLAIAELAAARPGFDYALNDIAKLMDIKLFNEFLELAKKRKAMTEQPEEIDVDGHIDSRGIQYIGKAVKQPDGKYICLANVDSSLCRVEVTITCKEVGGPKTKFERQVQELMKSRIRQGGPVPVECRWTDGVTSYLSTFYLNDRDQLTEVSISEEMKKKPL